MGVVVGRLAIGAPHAHELQCLRIPHRDAIIAIAIGQHQLVCPGNEADLGHALDILRVQASLAAVGIADLAQELSVRSELQDEAVVVCALLTSAFAGKVAAPGLSGANWPALPGGGPG